MRSKLTRRSFMGGIGTAAAFSVIAPIAHSPHSAVRAQSLEDSMVFRSWGGALTDAIEEAWVGPFQEEFGVEVIMDTGDQPDVQIQQQKGNPQFDTVLTSRESLYWMPDAASLLEPITEETVPNLANVYDVLRDTLSLSIPCFVGSYGIVYNTDKVSTVPVSWLDLWNEQNAGHIVTGTGVDGGWVLAAGTAAALGVDWLDDLEPVLEQFRELAPMVLTQYSSAGQMINLLETEDAWIGPWFNGRSWNAIDQGLPLGFVSPQEGTPAILIDMVMPKDAKSPNAARAFLNFILQQEPQKRLSELFYYAPSNRTVVLQGELTQKMPYGPDAIEKLIIPDWAKLAKVNPTLVEEWNKIFGSPA